MGSDGKIDEREWHLFLAAVYELMGRRRFLCAANVWLSDINAASMNRTLGSTSKLRADGPSQQSCSGVQPGVSDQQAQTQVVQHDAVGQVKQKKVASEQELVTVSDVWELLNSVDGNMGDNRLNVFEFVDIFREIRDTGIDMALADAVPMHFDDQTVEPEDISLGEVIHLCTLIRRNIDLTEDDARAELAKIKWKCRANRGDLVLDRTAEIGLKQFRRLLPLIAKLMRIDLQYILSHIAWRKTGRFEMTDTLVAYIMERFTHKGEWKAAQALGLTCDAKELKSLPDISLVNKAFDLDTLEKLLYNGGIIDPHRKAGISSAEVQLLFQRVHGHMPELLKAHAEQRKLRVPLRVRQVPVRAEAQLVGRTEFQILMSELHKSDPLPKLFRGPLHILVHMLERVAGSDLAVLPRNCHSNSNPLARTMP